MTDISFTDRELDVMAVLWEHGASTVAEVRERLADPLAYTTVLTILRTLEAKGHVAHTEEGKAHRYAPLVARDRAGESALAQVLDKIFGGSRELLLANLVRERGIDDAELQRLREVLETRLQGKGRTRK
ncbi:MAG TPA: BlaI/MecI/CopY family transcriptional regulator [Gemmatimonadaceae bacterium]|nr:BlaI/MecI/CopY family transcriptional regulator [Gemmatimonadaceae bacterium]